MILTKFIDFLKGLRSTQREILKGMNFTNTIIDSEWLKYKGVSPGGMAADYGLLYTLYRVLDGIKPQNILEFGLGQSSKLIHQYASYYNINAVTYEHDDKWIRFFDEGKNGDYHVNIKKMDLEAVVYKGYETISYKNYEKELGGAKFDLILVDGPFGSEHFSRSQIIRIAGMNLSKSFCIILDDIHRKGELETFKEIMNVLNHNNISFCSRMYYSSKVHGLICSKDLVFLTSL